ncbi:MAG: hypothetical protein EBR99_05380 [Actinobacteria bacterium]|nr:hypothetical protein [Actinomycetota bacterium]
MKQPAITFRIPHWYVVPLMLIYAGSWGLVAGVGLLLAPQTTGSLVDNLTLWASVILIWAIVIRWSICSICFKPDVIIVKKFFRNLKFEYREVDRFEYVVGKYFNHCYIGVLKNDLVITRTSYGPVLIYNIIPKGKRTTDWLENLNSALHRSR